MDRHSLLMIREVFDEEEQGVYKIVRHFLDVLLDVDDSKEL